MADNAHGSYFTKNCEAPVSPIKRGSDMELALYSRSYIIQTLQTPVVHRVVQQTNIAMIVVGKLTWRDLANNQMPPTKRTENPPPPRGKAVKFMSK